MSQLRLGQRLGYGLGHVLNDLCASMWFTYLLLYYHQVLNFDNNYSGVILLVGQLADGLSTTFVGLLSDKPDTFILCRKYGQKKSWHLIGLVCVLVSFPFIFMPCVGCTDSDQWAQLIYYSAFAGIFQFGWASMQISHLALIPGLTACQNERTGLTAIRYSMTVVSNITVFLIAWAFFGMSGDSKLDSSNVASFRNIMLVVLVLGAITSILFHVIVEERPCNEQIPSGYEEINGESSTVDFVQPMGVLDWFREPQFYLVAGVYMSTRLFVNLSQAYLPLYLQESLELRSTYVATIPLVMYSSSFMVSRVMKFLNNKAGRKLSYLIGAIVGLSACVWVYYGADEYAKHDFFRQYGIFFAAVLFGAAGSVVLITSLSLTAELISTNVESSAFVYGAMSFTDKVSNGLAVMVIQHFIPCLKCCEACKWYFRDVLFYAVGGSVLLGLIFLALLSPLKVGKRWRERESENVWTQEVVSCLRSRSSSDSDEETEALLGPGAGHHSYS